MRALIIACVLVVTSVPGHTANQNECAIWLCAPMAFNHPSCQRPKLAMWKRLLKFKGPIPSWSSCSIDPKIGGMNAEFIRYAYVEDPVIGRVLVQDHHCAKDDTAFYIRDEDLAITAPWCIITVTWARITQHGEQFMDAYAMTQSGEQMDIDDIPVVPVGDLTDPYDKNYCNLYPQDIRCIQ